MNPKNVTIVRQSKISRRDLHLLRHTIFMFCTFIIGWSPVFMLTAIDYSGTVPELVYTILQILAVLSSLGCMFNLFLYNHELRRYIKDNIFPCL
jgi:hypothetical protein